MSNISLPEFPCRIDMWDMLKSEKRPIVVYGMGNGADKLIRRFEEYGITIADFFASDGFVRGHFFHGMRVKSFSEIKESYREFVIVLSFASNRADVIEMLSQIDSEYKMYVPDMPVADENEYFDRDFYNAHYAEILEAYEALCDDESKDTYAAVVNYKLTGDMKYLLDFCIDKAQMYSIFPAKKIRKIVDAGAYNGDTLREAKEYFPLLKEAVAIEPDNKNFVKLQRYSEAEQGFLVKTVNAACWSEDGKCSFSSSGNRNSTAKAQPSYQHKESLISAITVDTACGCNADYIKYDVEGAEMEALSGSDATIQTCRPVLLVSVYHRSSDIFAITNYLHARYPDYKLYMRRLRCLPAWELNLILIKE